MRKLILIIILSIFASNLGAMEMSTKGIDSLIKKHEGLALKSYKCLSGKHYLIGYGNIAKPNQRITKQKAEIKLRSRLPKYEKMVNDKIKIPLTQGQFDCLTDLSFNLGHLPNKIVKYVNNYDFNNAIKIIYSYHHCNKKDVKSLKKRRLADINSFCQVSII